MVQIQDNRNSILSVHNDSRDLDAQLQDVLVLLNNISMDCEPPRTERPWTQQKENTGRMPCARLDAMRKEWMALVNNQTFEAFQN
jgi:hypothetical protein